MKRPWNFASVIIPTLVQVVAFKTSWLEALIMFGMNWYIYGQFVEARNKHGLRHALMLPLIFALAQVAIFSSPPEDPLRGALWLVIFILVWALSQLIWLALEPKYYVFLKTFDTLADLLFQPLDQVLFEKKKEDK